MFVTETQSLEESNSKLQEKVAAQQDAIQALGKYIVYHHVTLFTRLSQDKHFKLKYKILNTSFNSTVKEDTQLGYGMFSVSCCSLNTNQVINNV